MAWIDIEPNKDGTAAAKGRRFAYSKLTGYNDDFAYDVRVVTSELVTNADQAIWRAVASGRTDLLTGIRLSVHCARRWVHLRVTDPVPDLPVRRNASTTSQHGRGLAIVEDLASLWWVHPHSGGKTIHAVMAIPGVVLTQYDLDRIATGL